MSQTFRTEYKRSLAKPDPSIAQGSGRKPILRFVPAAEILQSNQIYTSVDFNIREDLRSNKDFESVRKAVRTWQR